MAKEQASAAELARLAFPWLLLSCGHGSLSTRCPGSVDTRLSCSAGLTRFFDRQWKLASAQRSKEGDRERRPYQAKRLTWFFV